VRATVKLASRASAIETPTMPRPVRRRLLAAALAAPLAACTTGGAGDDVFKPLVGRGGKDVMWVPTLDALVLPMLELAEVKSEDLVVDLGSGDGKIPIWAAHRFGARAVGIEYDAELSALAQRNAERAGVTNRVRMVHGDIFKEDFSQATVLTLYLGQALNLKLRPTILAMRPGTRVVSNAFDMELWKPDRTVRLPDQNPIFLWIVPARVSGDWTLDGLPGGPARLRLEQAFQEVRGTLTGADRRETAVEGRLAGTRLVLEERGVERPRRLNLEAAADGLKGAVETDPARPLSGRRAGRCRPSRARRLGGAVHRHLVDVDPAHAAGHLHVAGLPAGRTRTGPLREHRDLALRDAGHRRRVLHVDLALVGLVEVAGEDAAAGGHRVAELALRFADPAVAVADQGVARALLLAHALAHPLQLRVGLLVDAVAHRLRRRVGDLHRDLPETGLARRQVRGGDRGGGGGQGGEDDRDQGGADGGHGGLRDP
jgi:SAM-dependent methyltransferase